LNPHTGHRSELVWALTALVGFWFYSLESKVLGNVALSNHADAPALALGMLGCILYLESETRDSLWLLVGSAISINLAVWTKQVTIPLVLAVPFYALLSRGWKEATRIGLLMVAIGGLMSTWIFHHWGYSNVIFNLLTNPAHQPWEERLIKVNGHAIMELWGESRWMLLGFGTYLIYEFVYCGPYPASRRDWFSRNRWSLFAISALFLIPTSPHIRMKCISPGAC
jgi:hypothetical protein